MLEKTEFDAGSVLLSSQLPPIPAKRYFTIGEVADLCGVRSHVLRYWEQEFSQLSPQKRRGNRRYYQHHEVLLIRRIRELLYEQGFTISGARNRLDGHEEIRSASAPTAEPQSELIPTQTFETASRNAALPNMQFLRQGLAEVLSLLKTS